jgi:hypothetical protein
MENKMSLRERRYLGEAVRPGEYFVIVDISVPGGKMVKGKLYHGAKDADIEAGKLNKAGRNVQVIDAKWYQPAAKLMRALGMSEDNDIVDFSLAEEWGKLDIAGKGEKHAVSLEHFKKQGTSWD